MSEIFSTASCDAALEYFRSSFYLSSREAEMGSFTLRSVASAFLCASLAFSQGTLADYQCSRALQTKARGLVVNAPGAMNWIGESNHFWYYKSVRGGTEFVVVDAVAGTKKPAFDHERLAAAINTATAGHYSALALPFAPSPPG